MALMLKLKKWCKFCKFLVAFFFFRSRFTASKFLNLKSSQICIRNPPICIKNLQICIRNLPIWILSLPTCIRNLPICIRNSRTIMPVWRAAKNSWPELIRPQPMQWSSETKKQLPWIVSIGKFFSFFSMISISISCFETISFEFQHQSGRWGKFMVENHLETSIIFKKSNGNDKRIDGSADRNR